MIICLNNSLAKQDTSIVFEHIKTKLEWKFHVNKNRTFTLIIFHFKVIGEKMQNQLKNTCNGVFVLAKSQA